ncbi:unnamed protein product [Rotaria sp. Silwood2]|nr:unnamed protein product [Rotaria sp. Silwood2]CAF4613620.1 unnamed protein product [Rotaria sp. Silwood2]
MNVYRGQKTSKQELKSWQSNIGSIITMTSFLSTSMDERIANAFAETFDNDDNDDEATLFIIWVDKNTEPKSIFSYLYHADCEPDDREILFSLRTLFRIDKVEYVDCDETWYVNMIVVDEILRIETVDPIFKLHYFIQDLHNQLALMHVNYLKRLQRYNSPILKLYSGQVMTKNDLENYFHANNGNLISMNSFLSTTTDRYVARLFVVDGNIQNPETHVSVLYEIEIDTRLPHSVPFAELSDQSNFEYENEVLFSMGAVFRIGETCQENRYLWIVKLTLTTDEDEQWNILTEHLQEKHQQEEEATNEMNKQISMVNDKDEEIIITPIIKNTKRKKSRSFDGSRYSKREFCRSD